MWDRTPRRSHTPCSAPRQSKLALLPLEPPGAAMTPKINCGGCDYAVRCRARGVMAVTECREGKHQALICALDRKLPVTCKLRTVGGLRSARDYRPGNHLTCFWSQQNVIWQRLATLRRTLLPPFVPAVCLGRSEPSTLGFSLRYFPAARQRIPPQEPFGDPRPQAFFFAGSASAPR